ncbi:MAG: ribonuclease III [Armatimonadetes bacterium]|nr:ribonuclease III [Armatimonadota bacterium]
MLKWLRSKRKRAPRSASPEEVLPGYAVDPQLLQQALTHKSADAGYDNERLEFLGDAVLEIIVTEYLFRHFPNFSEGQLTRARVDAVSEPSLAEVARSMGLGNLMYMSRGEEASGGRDRPSLLSDAFEAVVAAVYLSLGLEEARRFVLEQMGTLGEVRERDFKSRLQEYTQERFRATPTYRISGESGPPHNRAFHAEAVLQGKVLGTGKGHSKKFAEQQAAERALEGLISCPIPSSPAAPTNPAPPSASSEGPDSTASSTTSAKPG